jgi:hypothetical protein
VAWGKVQRCAKGRFFFFAMQQLSGWRISLQKKLGRNIGILCPEGFKLYRSQGGLKLVLLASSQKHRNLLRKRFLTIAALANTVIPLHSVYIQGDKKPKLMGDLQMLFPGETMVAGGALDLALEAEKKPILRQYVSALVENLTESNSVFLLDREGRYFDVALSATADPPCESLAMLGKRVGDILGNQSHETVTAALRLSLGSGQRNIFLYPGTVKGEQRHYRARISPLQEWERGLLVVDRIA